MRDRHGLRAVSRAVRRISAKSLLSRSGTSAPSKWLSSASRWASSASMLRRRARVDDRVVEAGAERSGGHRSGPAEGDVRSGRGSRVRSAQEAGGRRLRQPRGPSGLVGDCGRAPEGVETGCGYPPLIQAPQGAVRLWTTAEDQPTTDIPRDRRESPEIDTRSCSDHGEPVKRRGSSQPLEGWV